MAQSVIDAELDDLEGIGSATKEKLMEAGIESVLDLAAALPGELVDKAGVTSEKASAMIYVAQRKRLKMLKCTTGSENLDKLLNRGIETQSITEFWGDLL